MVAWQRLLAMNRNQIKMQRLNRNIQMNMRRGILLNFASIALCLGLAVPVAAQPKPASSGAPGYPSWTGTAYPFAQHLQIMLLHFDQAALSMAQTAQQNATSVTIKKFAARVASERSRDIAAVRSAYSERYGQAPPAWPSPQSGYGPYGPGMMGGYGQGGNGPGMMGGDSPGPNGGQSAQSGYGPGMMGGNGPGQNGGPRAQGSGPWYGPMMGQGDSYQMMMGGRSFWWGSSNVDKGFVPALMRLDAMEISMATIGLTSGDANDETLARKVLSARSQELSSLSKIVQ